MKAVVAAFDQEKALVGAFSVITNLRMELFQALVSTPYLSPAHDRAMVEAGDGLRSWQQQPRVPCQRVSPPPARLLCRAGNERSRNFKFCNHGDAEMAPLRVFSWLIAHTSVKSHMTGLLHEGIFHVQGLCEPAIFGISPWAYVMRNWAQILIHGRH